MKQIFIPSTPNEWRKFTSGIAKANLKLAGMEYKDLELKLAKMNIRQSPNAIALKLSKGTFSAVFLLQTLVAIGVDKIDLPVQEGN